MNEPRLEHAPNHSLERALPNELYFDITSFFGKF